MQHGVRGMTLIEIIVAIVITSILVIGLSGMWVMVDDQFLRIAQRERALLVLNGHVERLAALYRYGNFIGEDATHADTLATIPSTSLVPQVNVQRHIYRANPVSPAITGLVVTETSNANVTRAAVAEDQVLFMDTVIAANDSSELNVVWLDRALNLSAKFSWHLETLPGNNCFNGNSCYVLVAKLEYPFRFVDNSDPAQAIDNMPADSLELRTVVGRRL